MRGEHFNRFIVEPAVGLLHEIATDRGFKSVDAKRMLLAIAYQESNMSYRRQQLNGPARGFWQFEKGGGVVGVLSHHNTRFYAEEVCKRLSIPSHHDIVWSVIEWNDTLACVFARLLLYSDPRPLPSQEADGWEYYLRTWRPGKPHAERWGRAWSTAETALGIK